MCEEPYVKWRSTGTCDEYSIKKIPGLGISPIRVIGAAAARHYWNGSFCSGAEFEATKLEKTAKVKMIEQSVFELGTILLKTQLWKIEFAEVVKQKDETIILQKIGKFWNQQNFWDRPDGLVVVTNYRLAFLPKAISPPPEFLSFPFESIENLRATRVMFISPGISFEVAGERYVFTFLFGARPVAEAIEAHKIRQ